MLIGEVMKATGLTRRAIRYYEEEGLISPRIDENSYRYFSLDDIRRLKEISILRFNDFSIEDISSLIDSEYKLQGLDRIRNINDFEIRKYQEKNMSIARLQRDYDIEKEFDRQIKIRKKMTVKEKLLDAFPLGYISYMLVSIFDRYLDVEIVTQEEERAYEDIISYLDELDFEDIPEELKLYIENMYIYNGVDKIRSIQNNLISYMEDLEGYRSIVNKNKLDFKRQVDYFDSDEYRESDLYKNNLLLTDYMNKIDLDYLEEKVKIINPEYREFLKEFDAIISEMKK